MIQHPQQIRLFGALTFDQIFMQLGIGVQAILYLPSWQQKIPDFALLGVDSMAVVVAGAWQFFQMSPVCTQHSACRYTHQRLSISSVSQSADGTARLPPDHRRCHPQNRSHPLRGATRDQTALPRPYGELRRTGDPTQHPALDPAIDPIQHS